MATGQSFSRLRDVILRTGLVDELQMRSALARADQWGGRLPAVLVEMGIVDEEELVEALAKGLKMELAHLGTVLRDQTAMAKVDAATCDSKGVFPISLHHRTLVLAMADPTDLMTIDSIAAKAGVRVTPVLASESEIRAAIARHYRGKALEPPSYAMRKRVTHEVDSQPMIPVEDVVLERTFAPEPPTQSDQPVLELPSANTLLDEFFEHPKQAELSEEDLRRLETCRLNQEKSATVLKAIRDLLNEKGIVT